MKLKQVAVTLGIALATVNATCTQAQATNVKISLLQGNTPSPGATSFNLCDEFSCTGNPGLLSQFFSLDNSSFTSLFLNNSKFAITGATLQTNDPNVTFSNNTSNVFSQVTGNATQVNFANGVISPGQYFYFGRDLTNITAAGTNYTTTFILTAVPEPSSGVSLLALGALSAVSMYRARARFGYQPKADKKCPPLG